MNYPVCMDSKLSCLQPIPLFLLEKAKPEIDFRTQILKVKLEIVKYRDDFKGREYHDFLKILNEISVRIS